MGEQTELFCLFTPELNRPTYELHHWLMDGDTVVRTLDVEEWRTDRFVFVTGRLEPVPPPVLVKRVDTLIQRGLGVNVPFGWRAPLAVFQATLPASADAAKDKE